MSKSRTLRLAFTTLAMALLALVSTSALAQDAGTDDVSLQMPFRGFVLADDETRADLDITVVNASTERRVVRLEVHGAPAGWEVGVWDRFFNFNLDMVAVEGATAEEAGEQVLRLRATPPEDEAAGTYEFSVRLLSEAGVLLDEADITISIGERVEEESDGERFEVRATFPILRGPNTLPMEFEFSIQSLVTEDTSFDMAGAVPQGWEIVFLPAFGDEKLLAAVNVRADSTQRVKVRVTPSRLAVPGDYVIPVSLVNPDDDLSLLLQATLIGRGQLDSTTSTGLLNIDATAGEEAVVAYRLTNFGTADLSDVSLLADAPPNWQVDFEIDRVTDLPVNTVIDVDVMITPPKDVIPGDYFVRLRGITADDFTLVDLRVTVEQSTIWGWLGIVIVVAVLGGLVGLFLRLGRR